jgi:hypothetical protein
LYSKKFKITLPKLLKEDEHTIIPPSPPASKRRNNSITSINSNRSSVHSNESNHSSSHSNSNDNNSNKKRGSTFRKILHSFSHKPSQKKNNSDNIERYLRHCVHDLNIQTCSLFKEFLQPQRDEDNVIPKQVVQSYVQQESLIVDHATPLPAPPSTRGIVAASGSGRGSAATAKPITPPPDTANMNDDTGAEQEQDDESVIQSSFLSYNSFISHQQRIDQQQRPIAQNQSSSVLSSSPSSSDKPVTIQDFQLIKVIGRGCMGKVSFFFFFFFFVIV